MPIQQRFEITCTHSPRMAVVRFGRLGWEVVFTWKMPALFPSDGFATRLGMLASREKAMKLAREWVHDEKRPVAGVA